MIFCPSAPKIRLTDRNEGFIEVKDANSLWKKVNEENWNTKRQKMLCQHLGFEPSEGDIEIRKFGDNQQILMGDLICYNTQAKRTSCCIHLKHAEYQESPYAKC